MPKLIEATPRMTVRLYKTISRKTVNGQIAVSARYEGKESYIDLTPFLNDGSAVRLSKSVREPAGAFSINFSDKPFGSTIGVFVGMAQGAMESIYGLIEPMDMIEFRMWDGVGAWPSGKDYPIKMRGIVSDVRRDEAVGQDGKPQRMVVVTGQDYGKFWQMFQVLYLPAYADRQALLTNFGLWEMFGVQAKGVMKSGEWVRTMIEKIINPFIDKFLPKNSPLPRSLKLDISVAHGVVNDSYQNMQGSIYDILKFHGDVGVWNELYTEDREDGVYVVYRPMPALKFSDNKDSQDKAKANQAKIAQLKAEWNAELDRSQAEMNGFQQDVAKMQAARAAGDTAGAEAAKQAGKEKIAKSQAISDAAKAKYAAQIKALEDQTKQLDGSSQSEKIQDDAPDPIFVPVPAEQIRSLSVGRSDSTVANFFWVNNARFDLVDDMQRKLSSIPKDDGKVSIKEYPNSAVKYYATRPMYADTQQGDDAVLSMASGKDKDGQSQRSEQMMSWIEKRLKILRESNKDNVVLERGTASIKGGPMRPGGADAMKAGDYARFERGRMSWIAYVPQIDDEFVPFRSYVTTLNFERGEGFVARMRSGGGADSPWLAEQATKGAA